MKTTIRRLSFYLASLGALSILSCCLLLPSTAQAATSTTCHETDGHCFITLGDQLIAMRQTSLTTLGGKITTAFNAGHITSDQASVLSADVSTNQNGLATLKTKLDAETDAQAARTDVMNIFLQFRIYAVVLPRDYRQLDLSIENYVYNKLNGLGPKIQQAISAAPADDQARLNALYTDYTTQLASVQNQIATAQTNLPALTPTGYNTNRTAYDGVLDNVIAATRTAHTDLRQAAKDLHDIATLLKHKQ